VKTGDVAREAGEHSAACGHWKVQIHSGQVLPPCPECHQAVEYRKVGDSGPVLAPAIFGVRRKPAQYPIGVDVHVRRDAGRHRWGNVDVVGRAALREGRRLWAHWTHR